MVGTVGTDGGIDGSVYVKVRFVAMVVGRALTVWTGAAKGWEVARFPAGSGDWIHVVVGKAAPPAEYGPT